VTAIINDLSIYPVTLYFSYAIPLQSPPGHPTPYSHSIVRIVPNELICRCKKFLRLENSRRPNRQMRMAFEFKEEFDRSRKSPLSATINIDRSTYLESTGNAASPT
jgi:hypothetical protein